MVSNYTDESIQTLDWKEHIRKRPGMYIGKLGDGTAPDDGVYILLKEVMDNSVDEYMMGFGKVVELKISGKQVSIRDFGRGIPLGKVREVASKMNTGAKYDSKVFKKTVGLNGVGIKAVNALSSSFSLEACRDGEGKRVLFERGEFIREEVFQDPSGQSGTSVTFTPDEDVFGSYEMVGEFIESMIKNYTYLNSGLVISFNGTRFVSKNGLLDLLTETMGDPGLYPTIHFRDTDIEVALTHGHRYGEDYYSYVNGQFTPLGGTHLVAFREAIVKTIRDFYKKDFEAADIHASIIAAISLKVEEPVFESQTKTKLGSRDMEPGGQTIRNFVVDFVRERLDNYLHKNPQTQEILLRKILDSERERKEISTIKKIARERAKKANLHNKKLRDCRIHFNSKAENAVESSIFITEGDSASGSLTKARDVQVQAVFSLKGKPLNSYGMNKKIVYENEEFNLLQAALNIEDGMEGLRYNKVIIATDADVDGMHIRLLLLTFFLQFFPDLIRNGHLHVLQTPLFRVRNKKKTLYCYSEDEKSKAVAQLGSNPEITRFKGLGEISPGEFKDFIGENIRLEPVIHRREESLSRLLDFYMGKNTPVRQDFIIQNLRIETDPVDLDKAS